MNQQQPKINIDLKNTTQITSPDGNMVFQEGLILRKASKFLAGTSEDVIIPIPVFFDIKTGEVLVELLPKELREEFELKQNGEKKEGRVIEFPTKG